MVATEAPAALGAADGPVHRQICLPCDRIPQGAHRSAERRKTRRMKFIAIDWDGTFTEDPDLWRGFVKAAHACGNGRKFKCFFVTARRPCDEVQVEADALGIEALFTS